MWVFNKKVSRTELVSFAEELSNRIGHFTHLFIRTNGPNTFALEFLIADDHRSPANKQSAPIDVITQSLRIKFGSLFVGLDISSDVIAVLYHPLPA